MLGTSGRLLSLSELMDRSTVSSAGLVRELVSAGPNLPLSLLRMNKLMMPGSCLKERFEINNDGGDGDDADIY